jgi:alpha-L-rhamnosidase
MITDKPDQPAVSGVRAEHRDDALGVASPTPRLSWRVTGAEQYWTQTAYEIEIERGDGRQSTGVVRSSESVLVAWPFAALRSRERVRIRVRVWADGAGATSWSDATVIEAGLFSAEDWVGSFIGPGRDGDIGAPQPAPYLRHEFELRREIVAARLYATALGVYEPYVNGALASDHVLAPGWTSYDHRIRVQTIDVTSLVHPGRNAMGAILGDGWYRGRLGPHGGRRNIYGDQLALLAQLEVEHADGSRTVVGTDETWRVDVGPLRASDLYDGETYDARLALDGWVEAGFDDHDWSGVVTIERDLSTLFSPSGPPVRRTQVIAPVSIERSPSGKTIVDFGQNVVGRLRIRTQGSRGRTITLRHAEILENGELCIRPLRQAAATDRYTLRGGGEETWEPRFTFHGFRYAEVEGWPGDLLPNQIEAVVCHSDLRRTGTFECSDPLLNRLHQNVVWSMRGNFLDLPTDCAQRDERLGWTGDVQIFAPVALFLYDTAGFLTSWLADLAAGQDQDGRVPNVVPEVLDGLLLGSHDHAAPAAAWGDAAVIVPWTIFQFTGDKEVLFRQYASMRGWVDLVERLAGPTRLWTEGFQYGDWLDPTAPPDRPEAGQTDPGLVATAYFARSADLLARVANVLGHEPEAAHYQRLHGEIVDAFRGAFVQDDGRLTSDSATAYSLALIYGLVDEEAREGAGGRLVELVRKNDFRISTGFVGTPLICDALCSVGAEDVAFRLLMEKKCPSWLYPLTMGATTVWERWDSMLPDGSVNPGEMTSFNHYAFGAVADWLHRSVAGLSPAEPGFRRIEIAPRIGGGLTFARATHETPYGLAEAGWRTAADGVVVDSVVPPNTTATVLLPGAEEAFDVGPGHHSWTVAVQAPSEMLVPAPTT